MSLYSLKSTILAFHQGYCTCRVDSGLFVNMCPLFVFSRVYIKFLNHKKWKINTKLDSQYYLQR